MKDMNIEEFLRLDSIDRFGQTIQDIKKSQVIWTLKNPEGKYAAIDDDYTNMNICVWGTEKHARYNCKNDWKDLIPTAFSIEAFLSELLQISNVYEIKTLMVSPMKNLPGTCISITGFFEELGIEGSPCLEKKECECKTPAPIDNKTLKGMFKYINDKLIVEGCKNDLRFSIEYLKKNNVENLNEIIEWLQSEDGYCDCEVMMNVMPKLNT